MGKFNWWRRHKKRPLLKRKDAFKGQSFFIQQILHGDFDPSDYYNQAKQELVYAEKDMAKITSTWIASEESLRYKLDEIERKYIKRHNKLMEDHHREESMMLFALKAGLLNEFGVDVWEESLEKVGEGDIKALYSIYANLAKKYINEQNTVHN
mgnify:FL=1